MKVRILTIFLFLYCGTLASSCNNHSESLQEGDLLFQNLNCGELCDAIEKVTDGVNGKDFSHCAMVVNSNDTLKVIEAIGDKVQINSLNNFFARSGDTASIKNVTIGRVKHHHQSLLNDAMLFTKKQIGQPYDSEFLLENDKWYCSELLYQAFKEANNQKDFFELFFPAWIKYYKALGKDIPEGKQGINPGLISRSGKIRIINISDYGKL
jgi:hypothetical protein